MIKQLFCSQETFPQLSNFSTIKQLLYSPGTFPQSRNFSTVRELFPSKEYFLQSRDYPKIKDLFNNQGAFPQSRNSSTVKEIFHSNENFFESRNFPKVRELFHKLKNFLQKNLLDQGRFLQNKIFTHSRKFFANKHQKSCNFSQTQDSKMFEASKIIYTQNILLNKSYDASFYILLKTCKENLAYPIFFNWNIATTSCKIFWCNSIKLNLLKFFLKFSVIV